LNGLRDGIGLVATLLDQHWDRVHPQLDAEADNDPTMRLNALEEINHPSMLISDIRETPILRGKLRSYSLRDMQMSRGEAQPRAGEPSPPSAAELEAVLAEASLDSLEAGFEAADTALKQAQAIEVRIGENLKDKDATLDLGALKKVITEVRRTFRAQLDRRGATTGEGGAEMPSEAASGVAFTGGQFTSREQVALALDRACDYFRRFEPSSPVPLLLQRAKRLIAQDFMTILRDLAPDGVAQAEIVSGAATAAPAASEPEAGEPAG
jgi:type VI secretion system protein ImpA